MVRVVKQERVWSVLERGKMCSIGVGWVHRYGGA